MNQQNGNLANGQQTPGQLMNNMVLQGDEAGSNWRESMDNTDRARFVTGLTLALKHLSPTTTETILYDAAKKYENSLFLRSQSRNQYIVAYTRKLHQIKDQIQMQNGGGVNGSNGMMYDAQRPNLQFGVPQQMPQQMSPLPQAPAQGQQPASMASPQVQSTPQQSHQASTSNTNMNRPPQR